MERFKAVEKDMKTKAYSKEGLQQSAKQDPKERERDEAAEYLGNCLDKLTMALETYEAEQEGLLVGMKKKSKDNSKTERLAEISRVTERYQWHEGRIQLALRALQNGSIEPNQIEAIKESLDYFLDHGHEVEYEGEDESIYDDLNLDEEEGAFGMNNDNDRLSSQDTQSIQDDAEEAMSRISSKVKEPTARRPSTQMKSPLPVLAQLNQMPAPPPPAAAAMKPAPLPTRPPGETLRYASAAAAGVANDKSGVGIAPLPPPPGTSPSSGPPSLPAQTNTSSTTSPKTTSSQPVQRPVSSGPASVDDSSSQAQSKSPALSQASALPVSVASSIPPTPAMDTVESVPAASAVQEASTTNGDLTNGTNSATKEEAEDESIYHLPPGLQDLISSFEITKKNVTLQPSPSVQRLLAASHESCPEAVDAEKPRHYKPSMRFSTPAHYPQEPLPIFDDPRLYENGRIDTDTLFYLFYYRQGSYQQYLAAKSLKGQSWRFHKQYQTWFQRHEEPKTITEEFEQGTYRFFDWESTW